jgi:outer membrane protein OmpA-like peptidoglycan-associated protein
LTPQAKTTLDEVVSKFRSSPRGVVELAGFTDPIGSANYNLGLSRQRAWTVQRYLVEHNVPLRSIHMVGLGKQTAPDGFGPEQQGSTRKQRDRFARRVSIRVFGAGEVTSASATDGQQE